MINLSEARVNSSVAVSLFLTTTGGAAEDRSYELLCQLPADENGWNALRDIVSLQSFGLSVQEYYDVSACLQHVLVATPQP